jgi:Ca2+-binding RTX toxin-like protein
MMSAEVSPASVETEIAAAAPEQLAIDGASVSLSVLNLQTGDALAEAEADLLDEAEVLVRNRIEGTAGDDVIDGTDSADQIIGGAGDDLIHGRGGDDLIFGNEGDDRLFGDAGRDRLDGGAGNDMLDGGTDFDLLNGGMGDDILVMNDLHDVALDVGYGAHGGGDDILVVGERYATQLPSGTGSATFMFAENFMQQLPEGAASYTQMVARHIEHLRLLGDAPLDAWGDSQGNKIYGNDGDNALFGEGGDDLLEGGAGDDLLDGGAGADVLYGGAGNDSYRLGLNDSAVDTIFDHEGSNRLLFDDALDAEVDALLAGDDLYLVSGNATRAVIQDYAGHEDAFAEVDFGAGPQALSSLLGTGGTAAGGDDLLAGYVRSPTIEGSAGGDTLEAGAGGDWLSGYDGDDRLTGATGDDVLEGGGGADLLEGGAGADCYLFNAGDTEVDVIRDASGSNLAELRGFGDTPIRAISHGDDLLIAAGQQVVFRVEGYVGNEDAFAGVQRGDSVYTVDDLLN